MKEIISIIPARGGSKGIPKKNIINFLGKPLIYWTIKSSLECKFINRTIVSSDNDEIIKISKKYGAEVIFKRPKKLSLDNSKSLDAIKHCVEFLKKKEKYSPYAVVTLQPTSPFRNSKHLDQAIKKFLKFKNADSLVSVQELPHIYDPYSVMKKKNDLLEFIFKEKNKNETIRQKKKNIL